MSDTVPITAGSGTTIGTDEVTIGGTLQHVQRVKLVDGTDGGTGLIGGDATNGLDVDVTRDLSADTSTSGNITAANSNLASGTATANSTVGPLAMSGRRGAAVLLTGTWSATLQVQISIDNANWSQVQVAAPYGRSMQGTIISNGLWFIIGAGSFTHVRVTASAYTSGTAAVVIVGVASFPLLGATVEGNLAHDNVDSGNPQKMGARARSSEIAVVSNDDRTDLVADLTGRLIVRAHANPENFVSGVASATGTSDTSVIAAQGAGVRIYVTAISIANSSAGTNTVVEIKDGSTVIWRTGNPAGGGSNPPAFDPPLRLTANTALNMACLTAITTAYFSASGFKGV